MSRPDPRVTLARTDLADAALEGLVDSRRYAAPRRLAAAVAVAPVWRAADPGAERVDELVLGERFDALDEAGAFLWGQARRDGGVGFVRAADFEPAGPAPTHRVAAVRTDAFAAPSNKAAAEGPFSLNSLVAIVAEEGAFSRDAAGRWFWRGHLAPIGRFERDPATVAEWFVGAPYLGGGRSCLGLDGPGLVQQALYACGRACPRHADQQAALGAAVKRRELARGDLACWPGHAGVMLDETRLIHADAHRMAVAIEPVEDAMARRAATPTAFRRVGA